MRIRTVLAAAATLALFAAACSGPAKKSTKPPADDVPQEITCCFDAGTEGSGRQTMPVESCPEEDRNPVDECDIGPGDAEPPM